jgi:hypothetical protein
VLRTGRQHRACAYVGGGPPQTKTLDVRANLVRIAALLISAGLFSIAYRSEGINQLALIVGGGFFLLMALLGFLSRGVVDSPYVVIGVATVFLFYWSSGFITGEYQYRSAKSSIGTDPSGYWLMFVGTLVVGLSLLGYGLFRLLRRRHV